MPLNLAINAVSIAPGGGMTGLLAYLDAWRETGADVSPTIFASRRQVLERLEKFSGWARVEPFAVGCGSVGHFLRQRTSLARRMERADADVVMATQTLVGCCRLPQVVHHRNLLRFLPGGVWGHLAKGKLFAAARDLAARQALAGSAVNVFISDYLRIQAEKFVPHSAPRNRVIYNGLHQSVIDAAESLADQYDGGAEILAVQSTSPHKNNDTLIEMLACLARRWPDVQWSLKIAGDGDWRRWRMMSERLDVGKRVEFLGFQDAATITSLMRRSLCLVYPSGVEGFGNPPLEAMGRRCPVVASDCTAIPEVVGQAGLLVPPRKAELFAEAVHRIHSEPGLRDSLVDAGVGRIKSFSWNASADKMYRVLADAAGADVK